ncbi:hypothetical protein SLEP1_g12585 [Rubroshorea leprosula]|uniref:Uncharacterized protein n=1 Tax=Rubroshorea leprosula TaxID=152421 RepID=A0AAV5ID03_9ROSI|nr:hypothetical protein SLEP1_g12585 [Rubroshorea leprosula]
MKQKRWSEEPRSSFWVFGGTQYDEDLKLKRMVDAEDENEEDEEAEEKEEDEEIKINFV